MAKEHDWKWYADQGLEIPSTPDPPLNKKQREEILRRDNYEPQMQHYDEQHGFHKRDCDDCDHKSGKGRQLQVHHIDPRSEGGSSFDRDNLITLCPGDHIGKRCDGSIQDPSKEFVVHPDNVQALRQYRGGDRSAYQQMVDRREKKRQAGEDWMNHDHDAEMRETARENGEKPWWKFWG